MALGPRNLAVWPLKPNKRATITTIRRRNRFLKHPKTSSCLNSPPTASKRNHPKPILLKKSWVQVPSKTAQLPSSPSPPPIFPRAAPPRPSTSRRIILCSANPRSTGMVCWGFCTRPMNRHRNPKNILFMCLSFLCYSIVVFLSKKKKRRRDRGVDDFAFGGGGTWRGVCLCSSYVQGNPTFCVFWFVLVVVFSGHPCFVCVCVRVCVLPSSLGEVGNQRETTCSKSGTLSFSFPNLAMRYPKQRTHIGM